MSEQVNQVEDQGINSEQAFDMLPFVADIYDKINFDKYRKDLQKKYTEMKKANKKVDAIDAATDATKYILKNSPKIKEEFFTIVAIAENRKKADVKKQSYIKTMKSIKKIFMDPDLVDFFKEAME